MSAVRKLFLLLILACIACTPVHRTYTSAELFPIRAGQSWQMANQFGDVTTWTVEQAPEQTACEVGSNIILHIQKNSARTYWAAGADEAEDRWSLHQDSNGQWRSTSDQSSFPAGCFWCITVPEVVTLDWRPVPGQAMTNVIIPSSISADDHVDTITQYHRYFAEGNTTDCIVSAQTDTGLTHWESHFSMGVVDTPAYKGIALIDKQVEGTYFETWYFAPRIGLVQIDADISLWPALVSEYNSPIMTIKRIAD
jgi:hypothetical protein